MIFIFKEERNEFTCYNNEGERAGSIFQEGDKWVLYSEFTGEIGRFDTAEQAKDAFIEIEREERERNGD